jgi:hypothetical protein
MRNALIVWLLGLDELQIRNGAMMTRIAEITNVARKLRRVRVIVVLALVAIAFAACIGFAGASAPGPNVPPNTLGSGGHPYAITAPAGAVSSPAAQGPIETVLSDAGATGGAIPIAAVGSGGDTATLLAVTRADGQECLTVAHAGGKIVEPLNCASGAYMRVWLDQTGSGEVPTTTHVIVVVSREVNRVQASFADGTTLTEYPDGNGVVTIETDRGAPVLTALPANGASLGSIGG